jgi:hypothetical protein
MDDEENEYFRIIELTGKRPRIPGSITPSNQPSSFFATTKMMVSSRNVNSSSRVLS